MKAGEVFTQENLRNIRPGFGLPPKYYDTVLGRRVNRDVPKGTPVTWDLLG
jgi:N-acetylneuraminate synthase